MAVQAYIGTRLTAKSVLELIEFYANGAFLVKRINGESERLFSADIFGRE